MHAAFILREESGEDAIDQDGKGVRWGLLCNFGSPSFGPRGGDVRAWSEGHAVCIARRVNTTLMRHDATDPAGRSLSNVRGCILGVYLFMGFNEKLWGVED